MHTFNTTAAEVQWTANSLLTFYITSQVLKLELCRVMSHNIRAGKYFAGNFSRAKECELNIPSEKYIRIIDYQLSCQNVESIYRHKLIQFNSI